MIISPLISIGSFQLDGIFIGSGYTREMRNAMVFSMLAYLVLLYFLVPWWGNHGLFLSLTLFMVIRATNAGFSIILESWQLLVDSMSPLTPHHRFLLGSLSLRAHGQ